MKLYPQRVLQALAATGFIALGSTAVVAQNDQPSDNQRDRRESSEWGENQRVDRVQDRDRDNQPPGDRNFQRNESQNGMGSREPWESRTSDVSQQDDGERPGLGVSFETKDGRAVISQVHPGSPAEEMGLRPGDRITQVNGEEVSTARDVIEVVRKSDPGDDIEIEVTRDGDDRSFEGELETRRQALVLRGTRGERARLRNSSETNWNSDRNVRRSYSMRGDTESNSRRGEFSRSGRSQQDVHRQLDTLQRQVQQINREIAQLRRSIDGQTGSYGQNETQAGYSEYGDDRGNETRTSYSSEDQQAPDEEFRGQAYRGGNRGQEADQENSPGGVVGGARTRPDSDWIDNR